MLSPTSSVSTMPGKFGEKVVMRIIDNRNTLTNLEKLGFGYDTLKAGFPEGALGPATVIVDRPDGPIQDADVAAAQDALRDVAKQVQRNREAFGKRPEEMPVFGTMAARFNDDGVSALYQALRPRLAELGLPLQEGRLPAVAVTGYARLGDRARALGSGFQAHVSKPVDPVSFVQTLANAVRGPASHSHR